VILLLSISSFSSFIITAIALGVVLVIVKDNNKAFFWYSLISGTVAFLAFALLFKLPLNAAFFGFHYFEITKVFSVLGSELGLDIFLFLIFATGFVICWIKKKSTRIFHLLTIALLALSLFNIYARAYFSILLSIYAVIAISFFLKRKWELEVIRMGTLLLLVCVLTFSSLNQISSLINSQPDGLMVESISVMRGAQPGAVLSSEEYGFLIQYYADKPTLVDAHTALRKDWARQEILKDSILNFSRLKDAEPVLSSTGIRYFLITPAMKEELWDNREQKLLFMLQNSESFVRLYEKNGLELWEYKPEIVLE
jgi:hypothetical protein